MRCDGDEFFPRQSIIVMDERVCHTHRVTPRFGDIFGRSVLGAPIRPLSCCFRRILEDEISVPNSPVANPPAHRRHRERPRGERGAVQHRGGAGASRGRRGAKLSRVRSAVTDCCTGCSLAPREKLGKWKSSTHESLD